MNEYSESGSSNDGLKITVLLSYYSEQRNEIRLFALLGIVCIVLSALAPSAMLVAGVFSKGYILLLISPALSIFFAILAMAIGSYQTTLILKLGDTEENVNKLIGEPFLQFSFSLRPDVFEKRIVKYWLRIVSLGIAVGVVPFVISLWLGISLLFIQVGSITLLLAAAYVAAAVVTLYLGYNFFIKSGWQKVPL
jgi:hypothetical protein